MKYRVLHRSWDQLKDYPSRGLESEELQTTDFDGVFDVSVRNGALCLTPAWDKDDPNRGRIIAIFAHGFWMRCDSLDEGKP